MSQIILIQKYVAGFVVKYNNRRRYGFIRVNRTYNKVFFHISEVPGEQVEVGDEVVFDLFIGPKGYFAESIEFLNSDNEDSESESDPEEELIQQGVTGVVKQYRDRRSFGFIRVNDTYNNAFFHISEVPGEHIEVGDEVVFDLCVGPKGYFAESIEFLNSDNEDSESESDPEEELIQQGVTGVVKQYRDRRSFGFIRVNDTYSNVFFHISEVSGEHVEVGDEVMFDLCVGPKGYFAESIEFLNSDNEDSESEPDEAVYQEKLLSTNVTGIVKRYLDRRRYGFLTVNKTYNKVFFHISAVLYQPVEVRDEVQFDLYVGPKGYFAKDVKVFSPDVEDCDWNESHFGQTSGFNGAKDDISATKVPCREEIQKKHGGAYSGHDPLCSGAGKTTNHDTSRISREKGNTFFKSARDLGSDAAKLDVYKSARECYKKAYASSQKDDDLVSAAKNIGTASWKIAKLKMNSSSDERKEIHAYFKDALKCFSTAYTKRNCMVQEWAQHLEKSIRECLDDIKTWIAPKSDDDRIVFLKEYVTYLPECAAKVSCFLHIATIYFRKGKDALKHHEYKKCQGYMDECSTTLNEAKKRCAGMDQSFRVNITDLEKDVQYQKDVVQKCLSKAKDDQARRAQEEKEAREKEEALDQLKGDLNKLERLKKKLPIEEFVEQVYKKWPPKGADGLKTPCASSSTSSSSGGSKRKLLIRAISQYHPDKVDKNAHGVKWYVMSGEITKCLNLLLAEVDT